MAHHLSMLIPEMKTCVLLGTTEKNKQAKSREIISTLHFWSL